MAEHVRPAEVARTLAAFVDVLIPGDADFPPASAAGAHGLVMDRIRARLGREAFGRIVVALDRSGPFLLATPEGRGAAVAAMEREEPELFVFLRFATYLSYYETPGVVATLRALGHDYNDAPQPEGYAMAPFDPTPGDHLPATPRGSYKRTEEIARVDLSGLAELGLPVRTTP